MNKAIDRLMSEDAFRTQVIRVAGLCGWIWYYTYDSRRSPRGFLDLVLVHRKRRETLFVELKTEQGRLSADQKLWIDALTAAGQEVYVWRPRDWDAICRKLQDT